MNERQKEILRILLSDSDQYVSTQHLAEVIGCSEKTVRNDLKVIESDLLQHTDAYLEKNLGLGSPCTFMRGSGKNYTNSCIGQLTRSIARKSV
ncbi:hypothetical protein CV632_12415 [Geobacillus thermodenitrificans]|uniref:HTH domain-containing protein n=1 Tax=Geobacillus thermodenitrificans TaxID=33940 RepID=UPI000C293EE6|nr:hypothetical protein CV632_12415 [Geobacillus thermodenitrificans]